METVPVDFQDYESEAAEWADMLADNRIAELAETDDEELKAILKGTLKNIMIKKASSLESLFCCETGLSISVRSLEQALFYWISGSLHSLACPFHPS
jgi:hypothetical protein